MALGVWDSSSAARVVVLRNPGSDSVGINSGHVQAAARGGAYSMYRIVHLAASFFSGLGNDFAKLRRLPQTSAGEHPHRAALRGSPRSRVVLMIPVRSRSAICRWVIIFLSCNQVFRSVRYTKN